MGAATFRLEFNGRLLERGFWLYVWEIEAPTEMLYYVGRTGDSSSINAQSPFNRMSQHLGFNVNSNTIRRHLETLGVDPARCDLRLVAHGPLLAEAGTTAEHHARRDIVAALEMALAEAMTVAGYRVMNRVRSQKPLDAALFETVRAAFAADFRKLAQPKGIA